MKRFTLKQKEDRRVLRGHLWVYRNELASAPACEDGALVDVYSHEQRFVARGFYQATGGIAVRVLSFHQHEIDEAWLGRRIAAARSLRESLFPNHSVYRWLHAESDGLPGLVADRYGDVVHVQSTCAYYARHAEAIANAFASCGDIAGVFMNWNGQRQVHGAVPAETLCDFDGVRVAVNLDRSQKTGLFLDQRLNRKWLGRLAPNKRVLDGHAYAGVWSIEAALAGAASVKGADTSAPAMLAAKRNAELNGVAARCDFETASVTDILRRNESYDIVVLDPPALAKTRASVEKALAVYLALNRDAMKRVEAGGYLITSSCSHFVGADRFLETIKRAARAVHRQVTLLALEGASPDHPVLLSMPETAYLKCAVLRLEE